MRLRKRVAFERFLARLAASDSSGWVLKGAMARTIDCPTNDERGEIAVVQLPQERSAGGSRPPTNVSHSAPVRSRPAAPQAAAIRS